MKNKTIKRITIVVMAVAMLGTMVLGLSACSSRRQYTLDEIAFTTPDVVTFGNDGVKTLELADVLGLTAENVLTDVVSSAPAVASVSGTKLTIVANGEFELEYKIDGDKEKQKGLVKDGKNVTTYDELVSAVNDKVDVCVQKDIAFIKNTTDKKANLELFTDLYGNGHDFDCSTAVVDAGTKMIMPMTTGVDIRDIHMFGKVVGKDDTLELESLITCGEMINWTSNDDSRVSGSVVNCFLENAHKVIVVSNADVEIKGCLIRNSSDATIAVGTTNDGPSNITLENNVVGNGFVAGINFYCVETIDSASKFPKLTIKGRLDNYNWRSTDNIKMIPATEGKFISDAGNSIIASEIKKDSYKPLFYSYKDNYYVHCGIFIICSPNKGLNGTGVNNPTIHYESTELTIVQEGQTAPSNAINYERRKLPMPSAAYKFIAMVEIVGNNQIATVEPDATIPFTIIEDLRG